MLAAVAREARAAPGAAVPQQGPVRQPEGGVRQRVLHATLDARPAVGGGVHEALVAGALGERRVEVVLQREHRHAPARCGDGLAQPHRQEAQLRVAPPEAGEPRTGAHRAHQLPQCLADVFAVGRKRNAGVPRADLLLESEPAAGVDLALLGEPVPARKPDGRAVLGLGLAEEALALTHEGKEWPRGADLDSLAAEGHLNQVTPQRHVRVMPELAVEAACAVKAYKEHASAEDPGRHAQLRPLCGLREEECQGRDLRHVHKQSLVLATTQTANVAIYVAPDECS
mmetsp:Transcript_104626/g.295637  ORF Transcript_104626/g.295637 Transcript_104626/m.295637 type:complete len:284 (-) Transcript_104626:923-1774(-)